MAELTMEFTGRIQHQNDCIFALFEADALGTVTQKEIPGGGTLTMRPMMVRKAYGIPQYIEIILSIGSSIGSTRAALLAGIQHASTPVASNNETVMAKVAGS
jgi:hypothetical protein